MRELLVDAPADGDLSRAFVAEWFERPGAATAVDGGLRLDTEVMLVEDPVKRVDNMTMAHGLEARTPFLDHELVELAAALPAGAQARPRRQGHAQGRRARRRPGRDHRPAEGLLPRARAHPPRGPVLELVREALEAPAARARASSAARPSTGCWPTRTSSARTLDGSKLWQLALLELWLQSAVDR